MINRKILEVRRKLDKLDNKLLYLIKKRSNLVDIVLENKKYKKDIVDNKRIKKILKDISLKSKQRKIDQIVTKKIWKSMIRAFIDYEYRYFKKK
jgi:chorismate mutase|tara:strand:- start:9152 stop:9433 length:282 start_codon:yes stop_codon:yes gene_type:complete